LTDTTPKTDAEPKPARRRGGRGRVGSAGKEAARIRQQRHRLLTQLRPREPASSFDPLELGFEALTALSRVRATLPGNRMAQGEMDLVAERIRRLSWGPD
jgi:hypothetical protein